MNHISVDTIYHNHSHEKIWMTLQNKMNLPVNVPATLDQVIDMLPHMPKQLQLHPLKLKCKLEYKSHYMYDVIRRD